MGMILCQVVKLDFLRCFHQISELRPSRRVDRDSLCPHHDTNPYHDYSMKHDKLLIRITPVVLGAQRRFISRFAIPQSVPPPDYSGQRGIVASLAELKELRSDGKAKKFLLDDQVHCCGAVCSLTNQPNPKGSTLVRADQGMERGHGRVRHS